MSELEIAELGKPFEIHNKDEVHGFSAPPPVREVPLGDRVPGIEDPNVAAAAPVPTLRRAGEAAPPSSSGKVQLPASPAPAGSIPKAPEDRSTAPDPGAANADPH